MFRGRGRGATTVVVVKETTPPPVATVAVVHTAPPTSCAPPSTVERHFVEYAYHDLFEKVWDDRHTGADPFDGSFFHPIAPAGFFAVGSVAVRGQVDHPHGVRALVVREPAPIPGHPHLLAAPTSFTKVWEDKGTGGRYGDCSFWWPNAPAGYVAIGVVVVKGYNQPHPDLVRCIHLSAVVPGQPHPEADGHFVWCDRKSRAKFGDVSVWNLHPGHGGVHTGTFVCANNYSQPNANFFTVSENPRGAVVIPVPVCAPPTTTVVHVAPTPCAPPSSSAPPSTVAYVAAPPVTGGHPPPASAVPYAQPVPQQHTTVVVAQPPPQQHATVVVAPAPHHHHHHTPPATVVVAQPAHHHHAPPSHGATVVVAQPAHHHHAPPPAHGHGATVVVAQPAHHHGPTVVVAQPARGGLFGRR